MVCPHCGLEHGVDVPYCPDGKTWTQAERDAWREQAQRHRPWLCLTLSNATNWIQREREQ